VTTAQHIVSPGNRQRACSDQPAAQKSVSLSDPHQVGRTQDSRHKESAADPENPPKLSFRRCHLFSAVSLFGHPSVECIACRWFPFSRSSPHPTAPSMSLGPARQDSISSSPPNARSGLPPPLAPKKAYHCRATRLTIGDRGPLRIAEGWSHRQRCTSTVVGPTALDRYHPPTKRRLPVSFPAKGIDVSHLPRAWCTRSGPLAALCVRSTICNCTGCTFGASETFFDVALPICHHHRVVRLSSISPPIPKSASAGSNKSDHSMS